MYLLELKHIDKTYHQKNEHRMVLQDVSFLLNEGETAAIMGPSGSGKTTLLNLIGGIDRADRGEIRFRGAALSGRSRSEAARLRRDQLGFVFQDFNLLDCLNVKDNILLPLALAKIEEAQQETRFTELSKTFQLKKLAHQQIADLSGGEKQRVTIARALANEPSLILADEPTGNLDAKSSKTVMDCFLSANATYGAALLMVTHDPVAASFCQRVVLLKDGVFLAERKRTGTRKEFFETILGLLPLLDGGQNE